MRLCLKEKMPFSKQEGFHEIAVEDNNNGAWKNALDEMPLKGWRVLSEVLRIDERYLTAYSVRPLVLFVHAEGNANAVMWNSCWDVSVCQGNQGKTSLCYSCCSFGFILFEMNAYLLSFTYCIFIVIELFLWTANPNLIVSACRIRKEFCILSIVNSIRN